MAKLEVFGTEAKGLRWDSGTRQDYVPVPPELAAEIERLQRCADALEIAETALHVIGVQNAEGYGGSAQIALAMAQGTAEFALTEIEALTQIPQREGPYVQER